MARPNKNNADYFSHDADMRNHRKIKALRTRYGLKGYALYCMLLEHLTGCEHNEMPNMSNAIELELIAGDFGVSATEISEIVIQCLNLGLFTEIGNKIYSEGLKERLEPVYKKRRRAKENASEQNRTKGQFCGNNPDETEVSATETPQSKVKKSKVKKSVFVPPTLTEFEAYFLENGFSSELAQRAFNGYSVAKWHDTNGKEVLNWRQKCQNNWFTKSNKKSNSLPDDAPQRTSSGQFSNPTIKQMVY